MDRKHDLDQKIKQALTSREQVPEELNRSLETQLFAKGSQRKISLWFLPAVANACFWGAAAVFVFLFFGGFLQPPLLLWCGYMILSGLLLSAAAYLYTDIKTCLSIPVGKRREKECLN